MTLRRKRRSILLVDDDQQFLNIASIVLSAMANFEVHGYISGPEALAAAAGLTPDLILLDVAMPGMDGPATLAELRKLPNTMTAPVMFITALEAPDMAHYKSLGAIGVIAKPFEALALPERVLQLWEAGLHSGMLDAGAAG